MWEKIINCLISISAVVLPGKEEVNRFCSWAIEGGKGFGNTSLGNSAAGDWQLARSEILGSSENKC